MNIYFAASTVSVGWSGYVVSFLKDFHIFIPAYLTSASGTILYNIPNMGWKPVTEQLTKALATQHINISALPHVTCLINLPAMFVIACFTLLLIVGIRESANFNNIMVITKVSVIIIFIAFGFMFIKSGNWHPFIPANTGDWGHFGWSGILRASGVIFFAYIGFDAVSTAAHRKLKTLNGICLLGFLAR